MVYYCAKCGKEMKPGTLMPQYFTDKKGRMFVKHYKCPTNKDIIDGWFK